MLIDTHAHLHFTDSYSDDLDQVLKNARDNGVSKIITVGTNLGTSQAALELAVNPDYSLSKTGVQIYATIGLHPHSANYEEAQKVVEYARQNTNKIVAIGECGLDYYRDNAPEEYTR